MQQLWRVGFRLLLLALCFSALPLHAWKPQWPVIYLTWDSDPSSSMYIHWASPPSDAEDSKVSYRKLGEATWASASGTSMPVPHSCYILHHVEITQLESDCHYRFKVGSSTDEHTFKTMPATLDHAISFVEGGDFYHGKLATAIPCTEQASYLNPDFAVLGGDLVYAASNFSFINENPRRWLRWLEMWQKVMQTDDGRMVPLVTAIGNHEVAGHNCQPPSQAEQFFAFFRPGKEASYQVLDFGDYLSLILLDSGHTASITGPQKSWLEAALQERTHVPHRFAVYHVPAYPSVRSPNSEQSPLLREHWVPLFEQYGIPVAFEHHDHGYKRSHPILEGAIHPEGVVYLGDGAWGCHPRSSKKSQARWYLDKYQAKRHFILTVLSKKSRAFYAYDETGDIFDSFQQP